MSNVDRPQELIFPNNQRQGGHLDQFPIEIRNNLNALAFVIRNHADNRMAAADNLDMKIKARQEGALNIGNNLKIKGAEAINLNPQNVDVMGNNAYVQDGQGVEE